jgi:alginate O-acetyltransferase complex protein AlgJ
MSVNGGAMDARSRLASQVIVGDREFLFHRDHQVIDQLSGELPLSPVELQVWVNAIETRQAWCRQNGIEFRLVIIPEKHVVYSDLLPDDVVISPDRPAMQVLNALSPAARADCSYPLEALRDGRSERETFFRTDTHFTWFGGYLVYEGLLESLQGVLPNVVAVDRSNIEFVPRPYIGDLGVRLEPEQDEVSETIDHKSGPPFVKVFENKVFARGAMSVYRSEIADTAPKCVIFRDSFANYIIPHLIPTCRRLVALSSQSMHYDLVRHERPDVVIFEIIERFVGMFDADGVRALPADLSGQLIEDFAGVDLAAL